MYAGQLREVTGQLIYYRGVRNLIDKNRTEEDAIRYIYDHMTELVEGENLEDINTCRDMKRSAWFRHMDRRVTPEDMTPIPVQPVEDYDAEELAQAIVKLPAKHKEVILLYYYQDMTMREIAEGILCRCG